MRHIYIDESIHTRGNFIVIAAVVSEGDIDAEVYTVLTKCGFVPRVDEFKSSMPMAENEAGRTLRNEMKNLIFARCKLVFAVCSLAERPAIMSLSACLADRLHEEVSVKPTIIRFDEGIAAEDITLPIGWSFEHGCDSKIVGGIQLADCAAHIVSTLILAELGIVNKIVSTHGHYPEPEVDLAWELWTSIRYALSSGDPIGGYNEEGWCEPIMRPYGLLISDDCALAVKKAVSQRLGEVWVGCIH